MMKVICRCPFRNDPWYIWKKNQLPWGRYIPVKGDCKPGYQIQSKQEGLAAENLLMAAARNPRRNYQFEVSSSRWKLPDPEMLSMEGWGAAGCRISNESTGFRNAQQWMRAARSGNVNVDRIARFGECQRWMRSCQIEYGNGNRELPGKNAQQWMIAGSRISAADNCQIWESSAVDDERLQIWGMSAISEKNCRIWEYQR